MYLKSEPLLDINMEFTTESALTPQNKVMNHYFIVL